MPSCLLGCLLLEEGNQVGSIVRLLQPSKHHLGACGWGRGGREGGRAGEKEEAREHVSAGRPWQSVMKLQLEARGSASQECGWGSGGGVGDGGCSMGMQQQVGSCSQAAAAAAAAGGHKWAGSNGGHEWAQVGTSGQAAMVGMSGQQGRTVGCCGPRGGRAGQPVYLQASFM